MSGGRDVFSCRLFKKEIAKRILFRHQGRIIYARGDEQISDDVYLIPHKTPGLSAVGKKARMYVKVGNKMLPDEINVLAMIGGFHLFKTLPKKFAGWQSG